MNHTCWTAWKRWCEDHKRLHASALAWSRVAFHAGWDSKREQIKEAAARVAEENVLDAPRFEKAARGSQSPSARYTRMRWACWRDWRMTEPDPVDRFKSQENAKAFNAGFDAGWIERKKQDFAQGYGAPDPEIINWFRDSQGVCWVREPHGKTLRVPPLTPNEIEKIRKWIESFDSDLDA